MFSLNENEFKKYLNSPEHVQNLKNVCLFLNIKQYIQRVVLYIESIEDFMSLSIDGMRALQIDSANYQEQIKAES